MNGSAAATTGRTWDEASSPEAVRAARQYEDSWRRSGRSRPEIAAYLSGSNEFAGKSGVRLALFRTDMALRWEAGEKVGAGWYLDRFPDLVEEALVALVYEEFCLREEAGERPDPAEYRGRYPQIAQALGRVFEIHGLVGSASMGASSLSLREGEASAGMPFPEVGQTIAGFHLVEELGKGAFARVFLAHERQLADRPVALKVTRKGSREPQTLARLQHTHIVPIYSHRVDPVTGLNLLCMPYFGRITLSQILAETKSATTLYGGDLAQALDRLAPAESVETSRGEGRRAISSRSFPRAIAWWGARLAEALDHAHERGVLHRDIKPSNVLVTVDGMPMLLDFNLAREPLVDGKESATAGNLGGTIDYMAPEHLEALADCVANRVDGRSDIFGLGVVLYEAVMGSRPFQQIRKRGSMAEALLGAADERRDGPPRLRDTHPKIPPALEAVIRRCLAPDPADRYQTGAELAADLQAVADDRPLEVAREPIASRLATWARHRRRRLVTAGAIALTLALVLAAATTVTLQSRFDEANQVRDVEAYIRDGKKAYAQGDFVPAVDMFKAAFERSRRLDWRESITQFHWPSSDGVRALMSRAFSGIDRRQSLDDLQLQANSLATLARSRAFWRDQADELERAADGLRFRLIGFGDDPASASEDLQQELARFRILPPAPVDDWTKRPYLKDQLDPARMTRLSHEVNELMFLWVSGIDIALAKAAAPDDENALKALNFCDRALRFVERPGPWQALRARLERRRSGGSAGNGGAGSGLSPDRPPSAMLLDDLAPRNVREEPSALAAFQWGRLYFGERRFDAATRWFERAVELEAKNYWYQFELAQIYDLQGGGRGIKAMDHYNLAVDLNPGSPWVHFSRARLDHRSAGNWRRAVEDLEAALKALRNRHEARQVELELGLVFQSLGDDRRAREYFQAVIRRNPTDDYGRAARLDLANGQVELGRIDEAMAEYGDLLTLNPMDQAARRSRALLLLRTGDRSAAIGAEADLTFLLDLGERCRERDQVLAARALARLIAGPENAEGAVADAIQARSLVASRENERLRQRALLASGRFGELQLDRPEEIGRLPLGGTGLEADLRRAVDGLSHRMRKGTTALYPGSLTQAVILAALGDPRGAEQSAAKALQASPDSPHALLIRSRIRFYAGDLAGAMADVARGLEMWPNEPGLREMSAAVLTTTGRPSEALKELKLINSEGVQHPSIDAWRARIHMKIGEYQHAAVSWSLAIGKDPQLAEAYLGRAECHLARREWPEAVIDLASAATWANADVNLEARVFLGFTRCLPHRPSLARRWLSFGIRLASHTWEGLRSGGPFR